MLPSVTRKCDDCSNDKYFQFIFYCDECDHKYQSEQFPFSMHSVASDDKNDNTRALLWKVEHDAAYERANTEALFHFNKCPKCGKRVCDDCYLVNEDECISCNEKK